MCHGSRSRALRGGRLNRCLTKLGVEDVGSAQQLVHGGRGQDPLLENVELRIIGPVERGQKMEARHS